jgi:hypothetical protein
MRTAVSFRLGRSGSILTVCPSAVIERHSRSSKITSPRRLLRLPVTARVSKGAYHALYFGWSSSIAGAAVRRPVAHLHRREGLIRPRDGTGGAGTAKVPLPDRSVPGTGHRLTVTARNTIPGIRPTQDGAAVCRKKTPNHMANLTGHELLGLVHRLVSKTFTGLSGGTGTLCSYGQGH